MISSKECDVLTLSFTGRIKLFVELTTYIQASRWLTPLLLNNGDSFAKNPILHTTLKPAGTRIGCTFPSQPRQHRFLYYTGRVYTCTVCTAGVQVYSNHAG